MGTAVLLAEPSRRDGPPVLVGDPPAVADDAPSATPATGGEPAAPPAGYQWWRSRWLRLAVAAGGLTTAVLCLRGRLPAWGAVWAVLGRADGRWLAAAVLLHVASMVAFGEQQRRLLGAFRVRLPVGVAVGLTYVRSAMSISLPAGSAVAAGYASAAPARGWSGGRGGARLARWAAVALRAVRLTGRVTATQWVVVGGLAVLNWLTDVVCLVAVVRAVGLGTPVLAVATAYLVVQVVRQVPVTPGGVGVIEASLLIGLTSAGAAQAPAAAAVLIYRVLSCWAILPVGALCWLAQTLPNTPSRGAS